MQDSSQAAWHIQENIMIKKLTGIAGALAMMVIASCVTANVNNIIIHRGTGDFLGTVHATAVVSENRADGKTSGDTGNYGYIDNMSDALATGLNTGAYSSKSQKPGPNGAANKAYANAVYDIIQQIYAKGGDGITNVLSDVKRQYDPKTRTDTATVSITADAIKLEKK